MAGGGSKRAAPKGASRPKRTPHAPVELEFEESTERGETHDAETRIIPEDETTIQPRFKLPLPSDFDAPPPKLVRAKTPLPARFEPEEPTDDGEPERALAPKRPLSGAQKPERAAPRTPAPKLEQSSARAVVPSQPERISSSIDADDLIEQAFAAFSVDDQPQRRPSSRLAIPAPSEPLPLPADALVEDPAPKSTAAPVPRGKRDIVETFRPGPAAPTQFLSGLAEYAEQLAPLEPELPPSLRDENQAPLPLPPTKKR